MLCIMCIACFSFKTSFCLKKLHLLCHLHKDIMGIIRLFKCFYFLKKSLVNDGYLLINSQEQAIYF